MPRPKKWPPTIRTVSGRDYMRVDGADIPLGAAGSAESKREYARWLGILEANGGHLPPAQDDSLTVGDAVLAFWRHAEVRYAASRELASYREAVRPLVRLFEPTQLKDFGPRKLAAVRAELAKHYCRRTANLHLGRIKRVFKWAAGEELLPRGLIHDLLSVASLRAGEARESEPVLPVPEADLEATLPHLGAVVRDAVRVQLLTAARPGEVLQLRPRDLQRGDRLSLPGGVSLPAGGAWLYTPGQHKTAHRGHSRLILLGPQAQAVLAPYLDRDPDAYCFSPAESRAAWEAGKRVRRKSRVQPSQLDRRRKKPRRKPGERYSVESYGKAVARACARAGVEGWHPHQLRHNAATRLVEQFGWETARILLGHRSVEVTKIYAVDNLTKAIQAIQLAG